MEKVLFHKNDVNALNKRRCFDEAVSFIENSQGISGRVLTLCGLRRTGKSTLMKQLSVKYGGNVYVTEKGDTMETVKDYVKEAIAKGDKIIFIDEITRAEDFISNSSVLADCFAYGGIDIVLAGTDSFGILLAEKDALLDRTHHINTTYIPFAEHSEVLNVDNMDDYITYGGLMRQDNFNPKVVKDIKSARTYLDSAVADNIANTIEKAGCIPDYDELVKYTKQDFRQIIHKMVELYNGIYNEYIVNLETEKMSAHIDAPFKDTIRKIKKDKSLSPTEKAENIKKYEDIDREQLIEDFKNAINLSCNLSKPMTTLAVEQLEMALISFHFLSVINTKTFVKVNDVWGHYNNYAEKYIIQPAIKYYHLKEAKDLLLNSPILQSLTVEEREALSTQLQNDIFGTMTENIVIFDTAKVLLKTGKYEIFKSYFKDDNNNPLGEYDMLIYDKISKEYYSFEIKHTSNPYIMYDKNGKCCGQGKHLHNLDLREGLKLYLEKGKVADVCVLYNGNPFIADGGEDKPNTLYLNITDFLLAIDKYKDMDKVMEVLTKDLPLLKPNEKGDIIFPSEVQACIEQVEIDL